MELSTWETAVASVLLIDEACHHHWLCSANSDLHT